VRHWRLFTGIITTFAVALLLTGCQEELTSPAGADRAGEAQQTDAATPSFAKKGEPNPVPFHVRLTVTPDPPMPPFPAGCELFFTTSVAGNATHLGRITGTGATCAFNSRVVGDPPFIPDGSAPPFFVAEFTNEMAWTAANGDVLHFTATATFVQSLTDGTDRAEGVGELTGGTGRFQGATGELQAVAVGDQFSAEGWIQYDASNRAN